MAFYKSIADFYDHIFPLNPAQVGFVKSCIPDQGNSELLDVGCGSGSLCIALAPIYKNGIGTTNIEFMYSVRYVY
jgi:2-polyprenyl-3-methyl-5-hydroxy-6-metoxy-1,4-benzoquinol methylase